MDSNENNEIKDFFSLICPECGVGNPKDAENCLVCDKDLKNTVMFLEDDSFDIEITNEYLIEYRKKFWGTDRTGKVTKYELSKIEKVEFGEPISRFIFYYNEKRVVFPLKEENMGKIKNYFLKKGP
ncbi:MAG: hypothetical protein HZC47_07935 [Methanobacterium sp.]|uniref:hypothetical protein n=1 Tax=Methanobacterium sp. TaxID=2164 RepID=UPI003D6493F5|nr:hypothetical protein [Methanobacterium sp.]